MNTTELKQMQSLPLEIKIKKTEQRIIEWYEHFNGDVYISFSGGKDSTVLQHLVRNIYPNVLSVYCDTGLEFPEVKEFVRQNKNTQWIKPEMSFNEVIQIHGYPVISKETALAIEYARCGSEWAIAKMCGMNDYGNSQKYKFLIDAPFKISNKCCSIMKKRPLHLFEKQNCLKPFIGTMASEGGQRETGYKKTGCNSFKTNKSLPLGFWTESDIWEYLKKYNVPYSTIYDKGYKRTGCMFCMFGLQLEKSPNRFDLMKNTHPKIYDYCMNKLGLKEVIDYIKINIDNKTKKEVKQMEKGLLGKTQSTGFSKQLVIGEIVTVESFNEEMKIIQVVSNTTSKVDFIPANKFKLTPEEKAVQSAVESFNNSLTQDFTELEICKDLIESINDILNDTDLSAPAQVREMKAYYTAFSRIILNPALIVTPARPTESQNLVDGHSPAETK